MEEVQKCDNYSYGRCLDDADYVIDPYDEDINNVITWRWLCSRCYDASVGDI